MPQTTFDPNSFGIVEIAILEGAKGKRRMKMVLDTGATYSVVPWHVVESLGYNPGASKEWVYITTASSSLHAPVIELDAISILGKRVSKSKVVVHNLPESSHVDGLLGLSYLKHFRILIDFPNGFLDISEPDQI